MKVEIKVDTSKLDQMAANFPAAVERAKRRALQDVGQAVASRATMAFRTAAMRPSPWAPRKPSKRDDGHPLMIRSGALRQSIGWKFKGADAVVVGTDKKYAVHHQFGTKHMPARPFMPVDTAGRLTPQMSQKISRIVEKSLSDELAGIGLQ